MKGCLALNSIIVLSDKIFAKSKPGILFLETQHTKWLAVILLTVWHCANDDIIDIILLNPAWFLCH